MNLNPGGQRDKFGERLDAVQLNFSGAPELLVGAPRPGKSSTQASGDAYLYDLSHPTQKLRARMRPVNVAGGSQDFGYSVSFIPDVNGDGIHDIAVGASGAGYVDVISGLEANNFGGGTLQNPLIHIQGNGSNLFGHSVRGLGDVTGDGRGELVIVAPTEDAAGINNAGRARVYTLNCGMTTCTGAQVVYSIDLVKWARTQIGDVWPFSNPDGSEDLMVGRNSKVQIHDGLTGTLKRTFESDMLENWGTSFASLGDLDGDGRTDFVAGSTASSRSRSERTR